MKLTKTNQVPYVGLQAGGEDHVDQPESVQHFDAHPGEGAEEGVVKYCSYPSAHTFPSHVSQDSIEEKIQAEEGEGHS